MVFGDEDYLRERKEVVALSVKAADQPPPPPEVRKRLLPNWAWNKRMRGR